MVSMLVCGYLCLIVKETKRDYEHGSVFTSLYIIVITYKGVDSGLKEVVRMVTSIPFIRCLCYKPERIRIYGEQS